MTPTHNTKPLLYIQTQNSFVISESPTTKKYDIAVRDLPKEQKPREKLIAYGASALSAAELLAVVLGVGTKKEEVLSMANRLIKEYGEKTIAYEKNPKKIAELLDVPLVKACQIVACFELGIRFHTPESTKQIFLRTPEQVFEYLHDMRALSKEHLRGLYVNSRYQLVRDEIISIGSATANVVSPREVYAAALEHGAIAVILAHNHPSGNVRPSEEDERITLQLAAAGELLGVTLLDHLVITKNGFTSIPTKHTS